MRLLCVETRRHKKAFIDFLYQVYEQDPHFRDTLSFGEKAFLYGRDSYASSCVVRPLLAYDASGIAARCMLIYHPRLPLIQLGFFEALEGRAQAVDLMLDAARDMAGQFSLPSVLIGLNGHLTYGVGLLTGGFDLPAIFAGSYGRPYYPGYFMARGLKEHTLSTYLADAEAFACPARTRARAHTGLSYREIDLKRLGKEMEILGDLFNTTLRNTPFYVHKEIAESLELFQSMKPLLRKENIIFAVKDGREVGFVFWHPNFNQVLRDNKRQSLPGFLGKYLLRRAHIRDFTLNAYGVLPEAGPAAIAGLLGEVADRVRGRYRQGESSFVWDANRASSLLGRARSLGRCRTYSVYQWDLD